MLKKCGLLLIFFGMTTLFCLAQKPDLNDSTVLMKLLEMESAKLDPEAKALVVYEKGKADVIGFTTRYKREGIIKVFNNDIARDVGTIFIPHQGGILLKNLRAQVYNLENGTIQVQSIEQNDLIKEKITDGMRVIKVYLPGVKKGSLIAYQYEREAGNMSLLQTTWEFQGDYPCLHSEFEANIPGHIIYEPIVRINSKLLSSTSKEELEKPGEAVVYREGVAELAISNNIWIRRNVPAFEREPYMASSENYIERVKLHLKALSSGGNTININHNWDEVCLKRYYKNEFFAKPAFSRNNFLNETVKRLVAGIETPEKQAMAIYNFVRDSTERYAGADANSYIKLKDVFHSRSGSNYELNLLLVAMLRNAGLDAYPVLLSTTERLNPYFPDPDNINYMVSLLKIGKEEIYLDASKKFLSFGYIPPYCLNGYARIISSKGGHTTLLPDQFKDNTTIMVALEDHVETQLEEAKIDVKYGWISSYNLREKWGGDTSLLREYAQNQISDDFEIKSISSNLNEYNKQLRITYQLERSFKDASIIYFNPFLEKIITENPFPASHRKYPVELPYLRDIQYILTYQLPEGFVPEEQVEQEKTWLLNKQKDLSFVNKIDFLEEQGKLQVYSRYSENNHYLPAQDYDFLRSFYERLVEEQNQKIVLKKL